MGQDGAAVTQIGGVVGQVVLGAAQFGFPEGHHLHQSLGTHRGNGKTVEQAFGMNQRHHQIGAQAGFAGFSMHQTQQVQAFLGIGHIALEAGRHIQQPDLRFKAIGKTVGLVHGAL